MSLALAALSSGVALAQRTNTLPATYAYPLSAANTSQPGFVWNVSQVAVGGPGNTAWVESQLAGEQGTNLANPYALYSSAADVATVPSDPTLPISFVIPGTINFSIVGNGGSMDCGHNRSDLPCEDGMVGTPGNPTDSAGGVDNIGAEALTYLALPQGLVTMGVRSDDGFKLQIGAANPGDRYSTNAVVLAFFDGGRGAGDSIVTFRVAKAGFYAARLLYYQNGGDASVEWYSFPGGGTNAVLVGDVANGGIPAYRSITNAPLGSYVSSFVPSPGSTGVPVLPTIRATIVNGSVPVNNITLTIDGTSVTPVISTTASGASLSYEVTTILANTPTHTAVLSWNDNGTLLSVSSTFASQTYALLSPSQLVNPDTAKPGFLFNIFANAADPLVSSVGGVQGGESDNLDNIELGLNGLEPDGSGGFLPNNITLENNGAAKAAAPALAGPNAPAKFIITNTVDLNGGNWPGFPTQEGGFDPSHSEVLTYVQLPKGLTTFVLNLDGFYRAWVGSWDYLQGTQAGSLNTSVTGPTSFSVYAPTNGVYPLRVTVFNLDASPLESLYTKDANGSLVLVNDVANGGLPAYYALSTPTRPYVRYASPRPVPRQVEYPNNRLLVRLQDGDTQVSDASSALNLDGKNVTVTKHRVGDVLELTWTPTTLQTPAEIHTGILTYQDTAAHSISNTWSFMNLKSVWLPTMVPGYYVPTNAAAVETFAEYPNPTVFTNDVPTGNWFTSPQPQNPLVDIAPVWNHVPTGPADWYVWNRDESEGANDLVFDVSNGGSIAYANWLCVDLSTFANIEGDALNTAPGEMINGMPLTQLVADPSQNILVAESDNRSGDTMVPGGNGGQTQFAISKRFDLSNVTNPVIAFASIQKQNQDNINSMEYSVDGGVTWAPIIYYLDGHKFQSDPADVQVNPDNTVNVINTLLHAVNPGEVPTWTDLSGNVNNTFGSGIGSPISQALAPFFAPRINDDRFDGKRLEVVRLPLAAHKSNVRLRLSQIGSCSWYWGLSQIAFYDVPPSGAIVPTGLPPAAAPVLSISTSGGNITVTWTGSGTLQSATKLTGHASDWVTVTPAPTGNSYTVPVNSAVGSTFFRLLAN